MNLKTAKLLKTGGAAIGVLLLVLSALFSSLELKRARYDFITPFFEPIELPDSKIIAALSLNYRTFAADIAWIGSVVEYGESTRTDHTSEFFLANGYEIAELDPRFRRVYDWFPNTYISKTAVPSTEELETVNGLIEMGMAAYPNDGELPFSAALNYIGYGSWVSEERRISETEKGIEFLERAIERQGTPSNAPFVLQWFKRRKERLTGQKVSDPSEEAQSLAKMLLSIEDQGTRKRIQRQLESIDTDSDTAKQSLLFESLLQQNQENSELGYLPTDLWIVTTQP